MRPPARIVVVGTKLPPRAEAEGGRAHLPGRAWLHLHLAHNLVLDAGHPSLHLIFELSLHLGFEPRVERGPHFRRSSGYFCLDHRRRLCDFLLGFGGERLSLPSELLGIAAYLIERFDG